MKTKLFALLGIFLIALPQPASADNDLDSTESNYVVIGAFAYKKNALMFTSHANQLVEGKNLTARFELNKNRKLFYVYVLTTDDRELAIVEANKLRHDTEFSDTWVYHGPLANSESKRKGVDIDPVSRKKMDQVVQADKVISPSTQNQPVETLAEKGVEPEIQPETETISPVLEDKSSVMPDDGTEGKKFFFKLSKAIDNSEIPGDVQVIDPDNSKKLGTYKGNVPVKITSNAKVKKFTFVCDVFGYRKVQRELDYSARMPDDVSMNEDHAIVIPFELVRLQKGDVAVMYNVYFFKDAGVMRPESRFEINSLYEMLKENPKYKIKIHGHTNGGAPGKIISLGESNNFFSLSGTREGVGSAKKLSEERAKVIREYLIANGIDPARMIIKAWGGKRPIHDKLSNRAQENVRVEIEILEN